MRLAGLMLCLLLAWVAPAAETLPPKPTLYFNDYAGVVPEAQRSRLNQRLVEFERAHASQIVVAVFQKMESASSIEDYANRVFRAWEVGQKEKNNGAVLFVFVQDRKLRIEVGYGLEGVLPDALCKRIIDDEIVPNFRSGDLAGGIAAGVDAILRAARGEYKGRGRTAKELVGSASRGPGIVGILIFVVILSALGNAFARRRRGAVYTGGGLHRGGLPHSGWNWWVDLDSGSRSGGGGGWGGGGGFSDGGFSGGGGSSGGGGASGSW
jgi:uncharacterized protein